MKPYDTLGSVPLFLKTPTREDIELRIITRRREQGRFILLSLVLVALIEAAIIIFCRHIQA